MSDFIYQLRQAIALPFWVVAAFPLMIALLIAGKSKREI